MKNHLTYIIAGVLFCVQTANCESCSMPQDAKLISVKIDNSIDLVCKPLCETNEEYVFEHCSNHQYEVVAQSYKHTVTINSMDDGGSYRCGCNDSYMYFIIQALASEIQINFPPIDKPTDYITGECTATGFPPPLLEAGLLPKECPSNTSYFEIDTHTGKVVVTTTLANEKCYNAIAYCKLKECDYSNIHVCPPVESIKLHSLITFDEYSPVTGDTQPTTITPTPSPFPPKNETSSVDTTTSSMATTTSSMATLILFLSLTIFFII